MSDSRSSTLPSRTSSERSDTGGFRIATLAVWSDSAVGLQADSLSRFRTVLAQRRK